MHLFKFSISFLAVGGATYALIKMKEAPPWLIAVSVAMAIAALITALPHLPHAIAAIEDAVGRIAARQPVPPPSLPPSPSRPEPRYEQPRDAPDPVRIERPTPRCAALVMSNRGGWGGSAGARLGCAERVERARTSCNAHASGACGNYAAGAWVAGIHCRIRLAHGGRGNSFAGYGSSESNAFARAYRHADAQGFPRHSCRRRVAISADEDAPRRYD